ncbi:unnamed protein product [Orchesella dallaii]|uniref:Uncharacterized protein n=1 Tax=Orchesella dallaii TaxID=48710 RepID=A0ABP1S2M5_9HEXA
MSLSTAFSLLTKKEESIIINTPVNITNDNENININHRMTTGEQEEDELSFVPLLYLVASVFFCIYVYVYFLHRQKQKAKNLRKRQSVSSQGQRVIDDVDDTSASEDGSLKLAIASSQRTEVEVTDIGLGENFHVL